MPNLRCSTLAGWGTGRSSASSSCQIAPTEDRSGNLGIRLLGDAGAPGTGGRDLCGGVVSIAPLVRWDCGFDLGDVLTASGPGCFAAYLAGDGTAHVVSFLTGRDGEVLGGQGYGESIRGGILSVSWLWNVRGFPRPGGRARNRWRGRAVS